ARLRASPRENAKKSLAETCEDLPGSVPKNRRENAKAPPQPLPRSCREAVERLRKARPPQAPLRSLPRSCGETLERLAETRQTTTRLRKARPPQAPLRSLPRNCGETLERHRGALQIEMKAARDIARQRATRPHAGSTAKREASLRFWEPQRQDGRESCEARAAAPDFAVDPRGCASEIPEAAAR
ncbi:unnamed protein product, partial [Symbiodinium microadriaticum]